jgi:hypothetical protein
MTGRPDSEFQEQCVHLAWDQSKALKRQL